MSYLSDNIPFIKVVSKRKQIVFRVLVLLLISLLVFPIAFFIHELMMNSDRNKLVSRIEVDLMKGYSSIYDYTVDLLDDYEIKPLKEIKVKPEMFLKDGTINPEYLAMDEDKYDYVSIASTLLGIDKLKTTAHPRGINWISDPSTKKVYKTIGNSRVLLNNVPFRFVSLEINPDGGYTIKSSESIGIGYKDKNFIGVNSPLPPLQVYQTALLFLKENEYKNYHYQQESESKILNLIPNNNKEQEWYRSSKYHVIINQSRQVDDISSPVIEHSYTYSVNNDFTEVYISATESYITIVKKFDCQLGRILLIISSLIFVALTLLIVFCYIPYIKRRLQFVGTLWVSESMDKGLIFHSTILGKDNLCFIDEMGEKTFTIKYASGFNRIKLSDGTVIKLSLQQNDNDSPIFLILEKDGKEECFSMASLFSV